MELIDDLLAHGLVLVALSKECDDLDQWRNDGAVDVVCQFFAGLREVEEQISVAEEVYLLRLVNLECEPLGEEYLQLRPVVENACGHAIGQFVECAVVGIILECKAFRSSEVLDEVGCNADAVALEGNGAQRAFVGCGEACVHLIERTVLFGTDALYVRGIGASCEYCCYAALCEKCLHRGIVDGILRSFVGCTACECCEADCVVVVHRVAKRGKAVEGSSDDVR